jgi:hypothetical protein
MARITVGDEYAFEILAIPHQTSILNLVYRLGVVGCVQNP